MAKTVKKPAKVAGIIVLVIVIAAGIAGLLSINLNSIQVLFPVAGQVVNQYQITTQPATFTIQTAIQTPEFGTGMLGILVGALVLMLGLLLIRSKPQKRR